MSLQRSPAPWSPAPDAASASSTARVLCEQGMAVAINDSTAIRAERAAAELTAAGSPRDRRAPAT